MIKKSSVRITIPLTLLLFLTQGCSFYSATSPSPLNNTLQFTSTRPTTAAIDQTIARPTITPKLMNSLKTSTPMALTPTISIPKLNDAIKNFLLTNSYCNLPCIWDFIPGESSVVEVDNFFQSIDWTTVEYPVENGSVIYTGKDLQNNQSLNFGFYEKSKIIEAILFMLSHVDLSKENQWLSFSNILDNLGSPDQIWISLDRGEIDLYSMDYTGYELYLFYTDPLVLIEYYGQAIRKNNVFSLCLSSDTPSKDDLVSRIDGVAIYTGSARVEKSPEGITKPFGKFNGQRIAEDAFGLTPQQIYDKSRKAGADICFSTPLSTWEK